MSTRKRQAASGGIGVSVAVLLAAVAGAFGYDIPPEVTGGAGAVVGYIAKQIGG